MTRENAARTPHRYLANVSAQGIGRFFSIGANFAVSVLIARLLGVDDFGRYSYVISVVGLAVIVAELGTNSVLARDIAREKDPETYWGNFLALRFLLCLGTMAVAAVVAYFLKQDLFSYIAVCLAFLPFIASRFFEPIYQVYDRPWYSFQSSMIFGLSYLLLSLGALFVSNALLPIVLAYLAANILYTIAAYRMTRKLVKPRWEIRRAVMGGILKLGAPIAVSAIFTSVNARADILMLATMQGDRAVGMYTAAYRFLELIGIAAIILVTPLIPIFSRMALSGRETLKKTYMDLIELLAVVTIPAALLVPHFSSYLLHGLFGGDFAAAGQVLNILAWAGVIAFFSLTGSAVNLSLGVVKHGYWNAGLATGLHFALNWLWIPKYGLAGAAAAMLISEICMSSISQFYLMKNLGNVFVLSRWAKILGANAILYALLNVNLPVVGQAALIPAAVTVYVLLLLTLRPIDVGSALSLLRRGSTV